jgi:hypothetical protein
VKGWSQIDSILTRPTCCLQKAWRKERTKGRSRSLSMLVALWTESSRTSCVGGKAMWQGHIVRSGSNPLQQHFQTSPCFSSHSVKEKTIEWNLHEEWYSWRREKVYMTSSIRIFGYAAEKAGKWQGLAGSLVLNQQYENKEIKIYLHISHDTCSLIDSVINQ